MNVRVEFKDGKYLRTTTFDNVGDVGEQHMHYFDHDTEITKGGASLWIDGIWSANYEQGDIIPIKAMTLHHFVITKPNTEITCIWPESIEIESAIVRTECHS